VVFKIHPTLAPFAPLRETFALKEGTKLLINFNVALIKRRDKKSIVTGGFKYTLPLRLMV